MRNLLFNIALFSVLQVNAQTTVTLTATRDLSLGYHDNHNTANNNFGYAPQTAAFVIPGTSGGVNSNRGLLDFDLSSLPPNVIIQSAKLNLYALTNEMTYPLDQGHIGENSSYLRRVTSAWGEYSSSWNTQPTATNQNQVILPQSTSPSQDYLNIDVTTLVQDMIDNPSTSHGFLLGLLNEQLPTKGLLFCTIEHGIQSKIPTLEIIYKSSCEGEIELISNRDLSLGYHTGKNTANTNFYYAPQTAAFVIPGTDGGVNLNRGLLDFNFSTLPPNVTITEAKLDLYALTNVMTSPLNQGHIGNNASYLRRVTSTWDEFSTTWNTAPTTTVTNQVILPVSTSSSQDYLDVDVTNLVQDIVNSGSTSNGFWLGLVEEQLPTRGLLFCAIDHQVTSKIPKLKIKYGCNLSVDQVKLDYSFSVYPNPASDVLIIQFDPNSELNNSIEIIDNLGKVIISQQEIHNDNHQIDINNIPNGAYLVKVHNQTGFHTKKFVKI